MLDPKVVLNLMEIHQAIAEIYPHFLFGNVTVTFIINKLSFMSNICKRHFVLVGLMIVSSFHYNWTKLIENSLWGKLRSHAFTMYST